MTITEESFAEEIAPARTFGFLKEVEMLRQRGLALGGSLDNADRPRRNRRAEHAAVRGRVRAPQDSRRRRRHLARGLPDHRAPGRGAWRTRAAHGLRVAPARRARRVGPGGEPRREPASPSPAVRPSEPPPRPPDSPRRAPSLPRHSAGGGHSAHRPLGVLGNSPRTAVGGRAPPLPVAQRTTNSRTVTSDPQVSNQSIPSLTRSNRSW